MLFVPGDDTAVLGALQFLPRDLDGVEGGGIDSEGDGDEES
jgi:hypothetical protein